VTEKENVEASVGIANSTNFFAHFPELPAPFSPGDPAWYKDNAKASDSPL
jgi:hypothetical protein